MLLPLPIFQIQKESYRSACMQSVGKGQEQTKLFSEAKHCPAVSCGVTVLVPASRNSSAELDSVTSRTEWNMKEVANNINRTSITYLLLLLFRLGYPVGLLTVTWFLILPWFFPFWYFPWFWFYHLFTTLHVLSVEHDLTFILYLCTSGRTSEWTRGPLEQHVGLQKPLSLEFVCFSQPL